MEGIYEVEKILNKRMSKGNIQYKIKWLGYSQRESTWEPVANLNCDEKLRTFEIEHAHDIIDVVQMHNMLFYTVRWKSKTPATPIPANRIKADFQDLLFRFFEKVVQWVVPQFIQPLGNVIEAHREFNGDPVNISYVTDSIESGELLYSLDYANGSRELVTSTEIIKRGFQSMANDFYENHVHFK